VAAQHTGKVAMWLLIATLATIFVSCSDSGAVDGPVLTSPRPPSIGGGGMEALIRGTMVFDKNTGCLFLERDDIQYPVVWPHGASWRADLLALELQGQLIEPGMSVSGGGGFLTYGRVEEFAGTAVADAARACAGPTGEIAFFNIGSDVNVVANE